VCPNTAWIPPRDFCGGSLSERGQVGSLDEFGSTGNSGSEAKPSSPWFALQVRARHELGVARFLRGRGYDPFVPVYQLRKRWSDRIKLVEEPLFPGYLFCRLDLNNRLPVLATPGVIQIVGFNHAPIPVNEGEIDAIKSLIVSSLPRQPWPYLQVGSRVQIDSGPLRGLEGLLVELRGTHRLVVSVTLLQRSVAVEIDSALVKAVRPAPSQQVFQKARAWQMAV
jgi:transcription antitermination factor NusG